ncbi:NmrA family NAD(P)-binding protein [Nocardia sp. NPDC004278]
MNEILVIGATGTTGSRISTFLRERGIGVREATRTPGPDVAQVRFDWADSETHTPALEGVSAVYLIAPIGVADPAPLVRPFLDEAVRHGVRRAVVLGSSAIQEADHGMGALYRLVRTIMPEWAVLRPSWFMQNFTGELPLARDVRAGEIVTATGTGRVAFIDADDIAAVGGHALIDPIAHNTEHILTGPQALSYAEAAAIIAARTGKSVAHRTITSDELAARLVAHGIPEGFAAMLAALDDDIRAGTQDHVTDTVLRVTGRAPRSFGEFIDKEL